MTSYLHAGRRAKGREANSAALSIAVLAALVFLPATALGASHRALAEVVAKNVVAAAHLEAKDMQVVLWQVDTISKEAVNSLTYTVPESGDYSAIIIGDGKIVKDVDLRVYDVEDDDLIGESASTDNIEEVSFRGRSGQRIKISAEAYETKKNRSGYFSLLLCREESSVVSTLEVMKKMVALVAAVEQDGDELLFAQIDVIGKDEFRNHMFGPLDAGDYLIVVVGDGDRVEDIDVSVHDADKDEQLAEETSAANIEICQISLSGPTRIRTRTDAYSMCGTCGDAFYGQLIVCER